MPTISASQCSLEKAKIDYPKFAEGIQPVPDSPNLVWVVFSGSMVIGVFADWPSASAKIGEVEGVQLRHWLDNRDKGLGKN
ncbi:hypothetical protein ACVWYU_001787 [Pseudomonas sp. TE12234]